MTSIPIIDLITIVFVLVDDWYQSEGYKLLIGKAGAKRAGCCKQQPGDLTEVIFPKCDHWEKTDEDAEQESNREAA